jgi:hypothetical protein
MGFTRPLAVEGTTMRWLTLILLFVESGASAAPTYLSCSVVSKEGKTTHINVTADEANQTATFEVVETGHSERRPAVFSPTTVRFDVPSQFLTIGYTISRTDLSFTRTLVSPSMTPITDHGSCVVQEAPKRAF